MSHDEESILKRGEYRWMKFPENKPKRFQLCEVENEKGDFLRGWWDGISWEFGRRTLKGTVSKWKIAKKEY